MVIKGLRGSANIIARRLSSLLCLLPQIYAPPLVASREDAC